MQLQGAQARWRSENPRYASLTALGLSEHSPGSHYRLAISEPGPSSYTATAVALGAQARDHHCRVLRMQVRGAETFWASGPDAHTHNPEPTNRQCWKQ
jgi:type IV pilus assembly protein PilE